MVRKVLSIGCLLVTFVASAAFSSQQWLAKRNDDTDAMRLRAAYADCVKKLTAPAEHAVIPLETFPNGRVKSRVTAVRAYFFRDSAFVFGEGVRLEQFLDDGQLSGTLDAENCLIDRKTRTGWIEGQAAVDYGSYSGRGRGVYISQNFIKVFSRSEIRAAFSGISPGSLFK